MIRFSCLLLGSALLLPGAAQAQYIGGRAPEPPAAPLAGTSESPEAALARNVRLLAINPRDYAALLGAGRAALRLGDPEAAIGFFGRAEELNAAHWAPKAGQGSALAQMGEGVAALGMFEQAQGLGATQIMIALDRGLAFDIVGQQAEAQSDYRAVLAGIDADEARRRLALSLGISNRKVEALAALDPLLARRDAGAKRARALILALGGDVEGARQAIAAMMPGSSGGFDPFLRRLPTLGPAQKAAAVHLGIMPAEGVALASVETPSAVRVAVETPPAPVRVAAVTPPAPDRVAAVTPDISPPADTVPLRISAVAPTTSLPAEPAPRTDRMADIEGALVKLPTSDKDVAFVPPPAPRPKVEKPKPRAKTPDETTDAKAKVRLAALDKEKAGEGKTDSVAAGKKGKGKSGDKDDEAAKPAKAQASRIYVQLAGGAKADQMEREFAKIRARKASLFKGRAPVVSAMKGWSRLLVGPFKDSDAAQEFVNDLHAARLEGFVWTAPGGVKLEKLASK